MSIDLIWLLEEDIFHENQENLQQAIVDNGDHFASCRYVPCEGGLESPTMEIGDHDRSELVLFGYGSLQMVRYIRSRSKLRNYIDTFCNLDELRCQYYYPRLKPFLFQQDYIFLPFGEIADRKDWLLKHIGAEGQIFIRPDDGYKTFTGKLVSEETWEKDLELLGFYDVTPEHLCVLAAPRNVGKEWRFVVGHEYQVDMNPNLHDHIIASTCYMDKGKLLEQPTNQAPDYVCEFVERVLKEVDYHPDPIWTIDICESKSGELYVLEVGSLSCSGYYGCDLPSIVKAVSDLFKAEWADVYQQDF
mgnify:CR=1 FL=1